MRLNQGPVLFGVSLVFEGDFLDGSTLERRLSTALRAGQANDAAMTAKRCAFVNNTVLVIVLTGKRLPIRLLGTTSSSTHLIRTFPGSIVEKIGDSVLMERIHRVIIVIYQLVYTRTEILRP
jgi:hypothetical protein